MTRKSQQEGTTKGLTKVRPERSTNMKFLCTCGKTIYDGTDFLPHKGHMIPDVNFYDAFDIVDELLDDISAGREVCEADYMRLRQQFPKGRTMYQCTDCGSIIIWNKDFSDRYVFKPVFEDTPHDLLNGKRRETKKVEQDSPSPSGAD